MRIEYDREANAVYVYVNEGEHARTVEIEPLRTYVDVDSKGRTLGLELLSWDIFQRYIADHDGLNVPEKFEGPQSLLLSAWNARQPAVLENEPGRLPGGSGGYGLRHGHGLDRRQGGRDAYEELADLHVETGGDALQDPRGGILLTPLYLREVGDGDVRALGHLPQRQAALPPHGPQRLANGGEEVPLLFRQAYVYGFHEGILYAPALLWQPGGKLLQ